MTLDYSSSINWRTWHTVNNENFHVGGTAQIKEDSSIITQTAGKLKIINQNLISG